LTNSSIVGVAKGDGDGVAEDFTGVGAACGTAVADEEGAGDWAKARALSEIETIIAVRQTNRDITLIVIR
jgi:hypothetical protein